MEDFEWTEFTEYDDEIDVRMQYVAELLVELPEESFIDDTLIWFVSKKGEDSWWSCGLSDTLTTVEEMLDSVDKTELRKLSLFLGESWDATQEECPHCLAVRHREAKEHMPSIIHAHLMEMPDEDVIRDRDKGRFLAHSDFMESMSGMR